MSQKPHIFALALPQVMEPEMKKPQLISASGNKIHAPSALGNNPSFFKLLFSLQTKNLIDLKSLPRLQYKHLKLKKGS
jgi:hypothetical protein